MSLFLILMLPLAVTQVSTITVRVGDDVTLPCDNIKDLNDECFSTTWLFSGSGRSSTSTLFEHGKIHKDVGSKSNRLRVTTNCLLVIKKVTDEDDGRYTCRQFISGEPVTDSGVDLSVTKKERTPTPPTTTTTKTVATSSKTPSPPPPTTTKMTHNNTPDQPSTTVTGFWTRFIFVSVGLAALTLTVVSLNIWTRTKGYKGHSGAMVYINEDEGVVNYENTKDLSAPVRVHRSTNQ
ncbi:uncharacterized protein LOC124998626 isoform X2 [Mugil cephalus]|uniref:uncharacterized protein LOC124998626 isoform X2 n=1 Tax=Mugil cephalus TaxID=48193 RepID=UPI001FB666A9|nr:uncharacterized protein LOC124998626 isoform X2 [Mugil cephalus]